ncbi:MAG: FecR domain-containing protein [Bacteroidales bacterium]|nr:FecR domain-containing protein [Bacteroidales bacterium]
MDIKILLKKYMDGICSKEEEKIARKWLDKHIADPTCDSIFEEMLDAIDPDNDSESLRRNWSHLSRFVDYEKEHYEKTKKTRKLFGWFSAAVVCASVAVAAALLFSARYKTSVQWHEVYAERGETREITLSDGTSLWLDADTKVIYPSEFIGDTRNIFVDGEIYADVTADKNKPFVVSTSEVNVKVHGTQFSVKAFAERPNVEVALISGSVTVEDKDSEVFMRTLNPGELIRYNHQFRTIEEYDINPETYGKWRNNSNLRFINQSLEDIASELERHFNTKIVIEDPVLTKTQYYASFINNEGLDKILQALNSNNTMTITRRNDIIVISSDK